MKVFYEFRILSELVVLQIVQIFPYWLAGVLIGSAISVYASGRIGGRIAAMKKGRYSFLQALAAAVLGTASPICMYGTIPMIAALGRQQVPQYILATFMISSIMLNPNLFLVSFALGTPLALLRLFISIAAGMTAGILVKLVFKEKGLFDFSSFEKEGNAIEKTGNKSFFKDVYKSMKITAPYFLIGIGITALFDRYFPREVFTALFSRNRGLGVLFAASVGVPAYICGGGAVPLLKAWLQAGMSTGSAVAFMLSGPATKLTNLSAVKAVLGTRNFVYYISFAMFFAVGAGLLTDLVHKLV